MNFKFMPIVFLVFSLATSCSKKKGGAPAAPANTAANKGTKLDPSTTTIENSEGTYLEDPNSLVNEEEFEEESVEAQTHQLKEGEIVSVQNGTYVITEEPAEELVIVSNDSELSIARDPKVVEKENKRLEKKIQKEDKKMAKQVAKEAKKEQKAVAEAPKAEPTGQAVKTGQTESKAYGPAPTTIKGSEQKSSNIVASNPVSTIQSEKTGQFNESKAAPAVTTIQAEKTGQATTQVAKPVTTIAPAPYTKREEVALEPLTRETKYLEQDQREINIPKVEPTLREETVEVADPVVLEETQEDLKGDKANQEVEAPKAQEVVDSKGKKKKGDMVAEKASPVQFNDLSDKVALSTLPASLKNCPDINVSLANLAGNRVDVNGYLTGEDVESTVSLWESSDFSKVIISSIVIDGRVIFSTSYDNKLEQYQNTDVNKILAVTESGLLEGSVMTTTLADSGNGEVHRSYLYMKGNELVRAAFEIDFNDGNAPDTFCLDSVSE